MRPTTFKRSKITPTDILQSVCPICGATIAFSSKLRALEVAEQVHTYRWHGQEVFIASPPQKQD